MNFQWFDLLQAGLAGVAFYLLGKGLYYHSYKVNYNKWLHYTPVAVLILIFFFSPVNITEKNATMQFTSSPKDLPEEVTVEKESFEDKQSNKLKKLEKQSEEKRNEEIDR